VTYEIHCFCFFLYHILKFFFFLDGKKSGVNRRENQNNTLISSIDVANTKLHDIDGKTKDCSEGNIAAILQKDGYRTGVVGKWHLSEVEKSEYSYEKSVKQIERCGFDYVDGIYMENLFFFNGTISHNMEWVTAKAIEFLKQTTTNDEKNKSDKPFFLYFNPTVPHPFGNVAESLKSFSCRETPNGILDEEPIVPKMTGDYSSCKRYRDTIFERSGYSTSDHALGSIWVDDSVGALLETLEEIGELENTIFLFQIDHGVEAKKYTLGERKSNSTICTLSKGIRYRRNEIECASVNN